MKFFVVKTFGQAHLAIDIAHGTVNAIFLQCRPILRRDEVNGVKSDFFYNLAKLIER